MERSQWAEEAVCPPGRQRIIHLPPFCQQPHLTPPVMPPTTSSQKPNAPKGNGAAAGGANGASKAAPAAQDGGDHVGGKPDQDKYNTEQDAFNKEIAAVKTKLVSGHTSVWRAPANARTGGCPWPHRTLAEPRVERPPHHPQG